MEAEGRLLRRHIVDLVVMGLWLIAALLFVLAGSGFVLGAVYALLSPALTPAGSMVVCGALCLLLGGGVIWYVRQHVQ